MKKKILILSLAAAIAVWGFIKYRSHSATEGPEPVWVQASQVKETTLPIEIHAIGTLVARSAEISPHVAEHVKRILFKDGTYVIQGTPLIQLDEDVYKAQYDSALAQLVYSENNYKRMASLGKVGAVSKQAIDQADSEWKEKKANVEESEATLKQMTLYAPFDGMVGKCKVNPGDYVTEGQGIVTITDTKHLRVEYNVPEKYLPLLKQGQMVNITTEAYPDRVFTGTVAFISPTINTDNRAVSLYAEVPNENNELAAGMFVNVIQRLNNEEHALLIPARSLVPTLEGEQVYKIVNGKASAVNVVLGRRMKDKVQIVQGLSSGDQVVTDGQLKIRDGVPVKVKID